MTVKDVMRESAKRVGMMKFCWKCHEVYSYEMQEEKCPHKEADITNACPICRHQRCVCRQAIIHSGDCYKRREVKSGVYQCGCYWKRTEEYGDMLVECPLHKRATQSDV